MAGEILWIFLRKAQPDWPSQYLLFVVLMENSLKCIAFINPKPNPNPNLMSYMCSQIWVPKSELCGETKSHSLANQVVLFYKYSIYEFSPATLQKEKSQAGLTMALFPLVFFGWPDHKWACVYHVSPRCPVVFRFPVILCYGPTGTQ